VVAQDVGFAINPTYIEGQIGGGVAQGIGQALSEEIVYAGGGVVLDAAQHGRPGVRVRPSAWRVAIGALLAFETRPRLELDLST
jgi:xanthine dehydrogenase molybdopterin-binding subunit B